MLSALLLAGALAASPLAPGHIATPPRHPVDLEAISALIDRVVPGRTRDFKVEVIPDSAGLDVFEVDQDAGQVVLRGSSGIALASALNWYLEHVAGVSVSLPLQPIHLGALPAVPAGVRLTTRYRIRYCFNYCTFSYTMAWWDWPQWERMIDWMALHGINMPLAMTGQEAVWRKVCRDFGLSRPRDRRSSSSGPAYLPVRLDGLHRRPGRPAAEAWIDRHAELQKQILARERELGMTPVLQGFTGHVPESITQVFPDRQLQQTAELVAGFPGTYFSTRTDPLFQRSARPSSTSRRGSSAPTTCTPPTRSSRCRRRRRLRLPGRHGPGGLGAMQRGDPEATG